MYFVILYLTSLSYVLGWFHIDPDGRLQVWLHLVREPLSGCMNDVGRGVGQDKVPGKAVYYNKLKCWTVNCEYFCINNPDCTNLGVYQSAYRWEPRWKYLWCWIIKTCFILDMGYLMFVWPVFFCNYIFFLPSIEWWLQKSPVLVLAALFDGGFLLTCIQTQHRTILIGLT